MARINVEDTIFKDRRFEKLVIKLKGREAALGACVEAWFLAQNYWKKGQRPIPKSEWKKQDMNVALVEVGLVVEMEDGFYVCGSKKHFDWLHQRREAAKVGGKKSAAKRRSKSDELPQRQNATKRQAKPTNGNPLTLTLPLTPSQTHTHSQTQMQEEIIGAVAPHPSGDGARLHPMIRLWNENCGTLPKVKNSNSSRDRKIEVRWREQSAAEWEATIKKILASAFCCGKNNTGWRATFDWILQPETWLKVNEGKYENSRGAIHTNKTRTYDKLDELRQKWQNKEP